MYNNNYNKITLKNLSSLHLFDYIYELLITENKQNTP